MVNIKISNRLLYTFIAIILVVAIIGVGYAYGTANPPVMGHSYQEVELPASGAVWPGLNADKLDGKSIEELSSSSSPEEWVGREVSGSSTFSDTFPLSSKRYVFRIQTTSANWLATDNIPNSIISELCSIGTQGTNPTRADDGCEIRIFFDNGYGIQSLAGTDSGSGWASSMTAGLLAVQGNNWRSLSYTNYTKGGAYLNSDTMKSMSVGINGNNNFESVLTSYDSNNNKAGYCTFHDGENVGQTSTRYDSSNDWALETYGYNAECWLVIID